MLAGQTLWRGVGFWCKRVARSEHLSRSANRVKEFSVISDWHEEEERERRQWDGNYDGTTCSNCNRLRVLLCANGKRVCEKCAWDQEAADYAAVPSGWAG